MATTYGRDAVVACILASDAALTLVVGDSGIGKSRVLWVVQERSHAIAPQPVPVRRSPGALQLALLEGLGSALAELTRDESTVERVGRVMRDAGSRVRDARLHDLGTAVGNHLLGVVRARLGDSVGDLLADYAAALVSSMDDRRAMRITAATDPDVIDVFLDLAAEVASISEVPIVLALDDLQRLDDSDQRRLADLVSALPKSVRIRGTFATSSVSARDQVQALVSAGASYLELKGLAADAVRDWLTADGVDSSQADEVVRVTNGYALHIDAAVRLLEAGESVSAMEPDGVLVIGTQRSWRELDLPVQVHAARLSALRDPLTSAEAAEYLDIEVDAWGVIEGRLRDAGVFTSGNEASWFHELRRRCIWDRILTPSQRQAAVARARPYIADRLGLSSTRPDLVIQYSALAAEDAALMAADPLVHQAATLTVDELAVLAALIELIEEEQPALNAEVALMYARQSFGARGDLEGALKRLSEGKAVAVASNAHSTYVAPVWQSLEAYRVIGGRAAEHLGRLPVPGAASALFRAVLRPLLDPFAVGHIGIGSPSAASLARSAESDRRLEERGIVTIRPRQPNLFLWADLGDVPFYAGISYDEVVNRDAAAARLSSYEESTIWNRDFRIRGMLTGPAEPVPSRRFLVAAERLTGRSLGGPVGTSSAAVELSEPIPLDEVMKRRAAVREVLRSRCSDTERYAYRLERPSGYAYDGDEHQSEIALIAGRDGAERVPGLLGTTFSGPFGRLEAARLVDLATDEHLGQISAQTGPRRNDPVVEELMNLHREAASFNDLQDRRTIVLSEEFLQKALDEAVRLAASDAVAIASAAAPEAIRPLVGELSCVLLELDDTDPRWLPGAMGHAIHFDVPTGNGEHGARVLLWPSGASHGWKSRQEMFEELGRLFEVDTSAVTRYSMSVPVYKLAALLGYRESELTFISE